MESILSDLVSLLFYLCILAVCCFLFYIGVKKEKESPEYKRKQEELKLRREQEEKELEKLRLDRRRDELRRKISTSLTSIDSYISSLSTRGIVKKDTFVNQISVIRSRPSSSSLATFEDDLNTCKDHERQARNVSDATHGQFDRYIDQLISGSMSDSVFSARMEEEKRELAKCFPQFNNSEYVEREKLRIVREVEKRNRDMEISRRLERERIERETIANLRRKISTSLTSIDSYISSLSTRGIVKKDTFVNQISVIRSRPSSSSLATFEDDLNTCKDHERQARNVSDATHGQFDRYIDQLISGSMSDSVFSARMEEEKRELAKCFPQFNNSEYVEREKLRIVREVEKRKEEARRLREEEERRRRLQLARQEEEMRKQLHLARQEEEMRKQLQLARQEEEMRRQLQQDRQEEAMRRQLQQDRQEEAMRRQLQQDRQEEAMRRQLQQDRQEEAMRRQLQQDRQEEAMRRQLQQDRQEEAMRRQLQQDRQEEAMRRQLQQDRENEVLAMQIDDDAL